MGAERWHQECGEPHPEHGGLVCRKLVHPKLGFHGGGHMFAPPDMTDEQLRAGLMGLIMGAPAFVAPATETGPAR